MSVDRRIRCERAVLVVAHARHAYGMVHATTGRERLPSRIGSAVRTDGCRMVDVGIRTHGTSRTTSDQRAREENRQTSCGRVVQRNEHGLSVPWMFFQGCPCIREEVNAVNGKPMVQLLAETRKNTAYLRHFVKVVELWECEWKETRRDQAEKSVWMLHFSDADTRGGRSRRNRSLAACVPEPYSA